jgi:DNA-binding beta-propeller fold protein YncE
MRYRALGLFAIAIASMFLAASSASGANQLAPITPNAPNAMVYTKGLALDVRAGTSPTIWVTDVGKGDTNDRAYRYPVVPAGSSTAPSQNIGGTFSGGGTLYYPGGIAVNPANGDVYIADTNHSRIMRFTSAGMLLNYSYGNNNSAIKLNRPHGLKIAGNTLYIANSGTNGVDRGIKRVSLDLSTWGSDITSADFHSGPSDIAVDVASGRIWAADEGYRHGEDDTAAGVTSATLGSVLQFDMNGVQNQRIVRPDAGPTQFGQPYSVEYDAAAGVVYMADYYKDKIFTLDAASGAAVNTFGSIVAPVAMSFDAGSRILYAGQVGTHVWQGPGAREIERFQMDAVVAPPVDPAPPTTPLPEPEVQATTFPPAPLRAKPSLKNLRFVKHGKSLIDIKGTLRFVAASGASLPVTACSEDGDLLLQTKKGRRTKTLNSDFVKLTSSRGACTAKFTLTTAAGNRKKQLSIRLSHPGNASILPIDSSFKVASSKK